MLDATKFYGMVPVWMTLIFTQSQSAAGLLEPVQSLCCKVVWSNPVGRDCWFGKGDDFKEVLEVWWIWIVWAFALLVSRCLVISKYCWNLLLHGCVCVCVLVLACVCVRARVCVCVCVCVQWEAGTDGLSVSAAGGDGLPARDRQRSPGGGGGGGRPLWSPDTGAERQPHGDRTVG